MFLSPWHTILAIYFSWDYVRSLVLSDLPDIPRLISLHYVPTPLPFPFKQLYLKIVIQTHYITFQDINLQPYFKMACVKSVLWPVLNSKVVDVSLSDGSLGYWTACNNFERYCTLPYCDLITVQITCKWPGAMPSAGTVLNTKFHMSFKKFRWLSMISNQPFLPRKSSRILQHIECQFIDAWHQRDHRSNYVDT